MEEVRKGWWVNVWAGLQEMGTVGGEEVVICCDGGKCPGQGWVRDQVGVAATQKMTGATPP